MKVDMEPRPSSPSVNLFEPGLLEQLVRRRVRPARLTSAESKLAVVLLAWLPLAILTAVGGNLVSGSDVPFAKDFAAHVRFLVELPLLLGASSFAAPLVSRSFAYLDGSGLVPAERRAEFRALLSSTRRASNSAIVSIVVFALAVAASWAELPSWVEMVAPRGESSWRAHHGAITHAGLWYALVARPILYAQFALLVYRFLLWAWMLARTSRIARPVPAHPDGVGGLGPIDAGHDGFAVIALVIGLDLAAGLANRLVHLHADVATYRTPIVATVVATTVLLLAPMLVFVPSLYRARVEATFGFGDTATREARRIDRAILASEPDVAESFKEHGHIAESLKRVRELRLVPIQRTTLLIFVLAVALPLPFAALSELSVPDMLGRVHHLMELRPFPGRE